MGKHDSIITNNKGQPRYLSLYSIITGTYKFYGNYPTLFYNYLWTSTQRGLIGKLRKYTRPIPSYYCIDIADLPEQIICPPTVFGIGPDFDLKESIQKFDNWIEDTILNKIDMLGEQKYG